MIEGGGGDGSSAGTGASTGLGPQRFRLREELARARRVRAVPTSHPIQSSAEAASHLEERAAKRRAGFVEPTPTNPQDVDGWLSEKHLELRDAIEVGDKESVIFGSDRSDSERSGDSQQHGGVVRIVAHQCGWLGCRVREATNPGPSQRRCRRPVAGRDVAPRLNVATQVDSSDDSRPGSDELLDALERDLTVVAPKRRARRVFNDGEALVHLSRGRFQGFSSDDEEEEHHECHANRSRSGKRSRRSTICVAVAAPSVVDGGRVGLQD